MSDEKIVQTAAAQVQCHETEDFNTLAIAIPEGTALANITGTDNSEAGKRIVEQVLSVTAHRLGFVDQDKANASLKLMEGLGPKDAAEGILAAQVVASHHLAMRLSEAATHVTEAQTAIAYSKAATNLMRTTATLLETLDRKRRGPTQQVIRIERLDISEGGQAIVGTAVGGQVGGSK